MDEEAGMVQDRPAQGVIMVPDLPGIKSTDLQKYRYMMGVSGICAGVIGLLLYIVFQPACTKLTLMMPRSGETAGALRHSGVADGTTPFCGLIAVSVSLLVVGCYYVYASSDRVHMDLVKQMKSRKSGQSDVIHAIMAVTSVLIIFLMAGAVEVLAIVFAASLQISEYVFYYLGNQGNLLNFVRRDQESTRIPPTVQQGIPFFQPYLFGIITHAILSVVIIVLELISLTSSRYDTSVAFNIAVFTVVLLQGIIPIYYYWHFNNFNPNFDTPQDPIIFKREIVHRIEKILFVCLIILEIVLIPGVR